MDHAAHSGLVGAAFAVGRSFQPNLLTRGTLDQAIISGTTSAGAYGVFSAGDALLGAIASRFSRSSNPGALSRTLVAGTVGAAAAAGAVALSWREHESRYRAYGRLAAQTAAAVSAASLTATATASVPGGTGRRLALGVAALAGAAAWASTQPWKTAPGSLLPEAVPGAIEVNGRYFFQDAVKEVSPAKALGIAVGVGAATYGLARTESALTSGLSRVATKVVGGEPQDHRMLGRMTSAALTIGLGWFAVREVSALLAKSGGGVDPGLRTPPTTPEVTGSPASGLDWLKQTREGARWLSMALPPSTINAVMGIEDALQPIRVYASLEIADTEQGRAEVLLREIDRTKALERKAFAIFSPTGSGYVNYVACETFEYLMHGNCASAAIQYSVLPSALSLNDVSMGARQTRMVIQGVVERLLAMPERKRPKFYLFGESLGSWVCEDLFVGQGTLGLEGTGVDAAVWIGSPSGSVWRKQMWGDRTIAEAPEVGPGSVYLPRTIADWRDLPAEERAKVRFMLLQNGDDPIPKFGSEVAWRKPDWLGPEHTRPIGSPKGTRWFPGTTFLMTFVDMQNALLPTPGVFSEGGHDYRVVIPEALRQTWRLRATDAQMERVNDALRRRELAWELYREWTEALDKPADKRDEAKAKVLANAAKFTGRPIDEAALQAIIDADLQPTG